MSKSHTDLDGNMESEGGSERDYDERILDEDFEMKERGGDSDGDDVSESSETADESRKGEGKKTEERIVHVVSPEPEVGQVPLPVAGSSRDMRTAEVDGDGGKSTDGIPDTGAKENVPEKGEPEKKGQSERTDKRDNEIEVEEERVDRMDPSLRPDHRYYAVRSMLAKASSPAS
jgi:hypothetical protein